MYTAYNIEVVEYLFGSSSGVGKKSYVKYNSSDVLDIVQLNEQQLQYLYKDSNILYFMSPSTYEQIEIPSTILDDVLQYYLLDGRLYTVRYYNDNIISIEIPEKIQMNVIECSDGVNSSDNTALKQAKLQNNLYVDVPMFISVGDEIIVSSSNHKYLQRAKE